MKNFKNLTVGLIAVLLATLALAGVAEANPRAFAETLSTQHGWEKFQQAFGSNGQIDVVKVANTACKAVGNTYKTCPQAWLAMNNLPSSISADSFYSRATTGNGLEAASKTTAMLSEARPQQQAAAPARQAVNSPAPAPQAQVRTVVQTRTVVQRVEDPAMRAAVKEMKGQLAVALKKLKAVNDRPVVTPEALEKAKADFNTALTAVSEHLKVVSAQGGENSDTIATLQTAIGQMRTDLAGKASQVDLDNLTTQINGLSGQMEGMATQSEVESNFYATWAGLVGLFILLVGFSFWTYRRLKKTEAAQAKTDERMTVVEDAVTPFVNRELQNMHGLRWLGHYNTKALSEVGVAGEPVRCEANGQVYDFMAYRNSDTKLNHIMLSIPRSLKKSDEFIMVHLNNVEKSVAKAIKDGRLPPSEIVEEEINLGPVVGLRAVA